MTEIISHQQLPRRTIRSYVLRQGRLTRRQQQALQQHWPVIGIDYHEAPLELATLFASEGPVTLEIGFGMGTSLITMAQQQPQRNFLGVEVHTPGVGACLADAAEAGLTNLRLMQHDALSVLTHMITDQALDQVLLFFPDPWHKARHHKRRIVQPDFARLIWRKLRPGGVLHMATDWQPYAQHMLGVLSAETGYQNLSPTGDYLLRPASRPLTKFEQRGQRLGHGVWDLMFAKQPIQEQADVDKQTDICKPSS